MIEIGGVSLLDLLPESIADDAEVRAISLALDPEVRAVAAALWQAVVWPALDDAAEPVLDEVARGLGLQELQLWDLASIDGKRAILRGCMAWRKRSGTLYALRHAVELLEVEGKIVEWWEESAAPFTYRLRLVVTGGPGLTLKHFLALDELVRRFTPTRAQLSELAAEADSSGRVLLYPALTVAHFTEIGHYP